MIHKLRLAALGVIVALIAFGAQMAVTTQPAFADDHGKGKGRGNPHESREGSRDGGRHEGPGGGPYVDININFGDPDRRAIYDYYGDVARYGHCPPGLAKKHNGCLPPGQAKKWVIGRPLPRDVVYYALPPDLLVRITPPPQGYRYVRVASDVLMIAAGTGMVAAAIEDLARY